MLMLLGTATSSLLTRLVLFCLVTMMQPNLSTEMVTSALKFPDPEQVLVSALEAGHGLPISQWESGPALDDVR